MPQTFLIFDFGTNEEAAQRARHSVEGWRQGFRLDRKLLLKFDRQEPAQAAEDKGAAGGESEKKPADGGEGHIVLMVRLDFSDHEKLSHHRWAERIPGEAAFKEAQTKVVRPGDADFASTSDKFDELP